MLDEEENGRLYLVKGDLKKCKGKNLRKKEAKHKFEEKRGETQI
jgi:hypothetical protein